MGTSETGFLEEGSRWEVSVVLEKTRKAGRIVCKGAEKRKTSFTEDGKETCSPTVEGLGKDMSASQGTST